MPAWLKREVRDKLDAIGISERTLFPGLDGLCTWLRRRASAGWWGLVVVAAGAPCCSSRARPPLALFPPAPPPPHPSPPLGRYYTAGVRQARRPGPRAAAGAGGDDGETVYTDVAPSGRSEAAWGDGL